MTIGAGAKKRKKGLLLDEWLSRFFHGDNYPDTRCALLEVDAAPAPAHVRYSLAGFADSYAHAMREAFSTNAADGRVKFVPMLLAAPFDFGSSGNGALIRLEQASVVRKASDAICGNHQRCGAPNSWATTVGVAVDVILAMVRHASALLLRCCVDTAGAAGAAAAAVDHLEVAVATLQNLVYFCGRVGSARDRLEAVITALPHQQDALPPAELVSRAMVLRAAMRQAAGTTHWGGDAAIRDLQERHRRRCGQRRAAAAAVESFALARTLPTVLRLSTPNVDPAWVASQAACVLHLPT